MAEKVRIQLAVSYATPLQYEPSPSNPKSPFPNRHGKLLPRAGRADKRVDFFEENQLLFQRRDLPPIGSALVPWLAARATGKGVKLTPRPRASPVSANPQPITTP